MREAAEAVLWKEEKCILIGMEKKRKIMECRNRSRREGLADFLYLLIKDGGKVISTRGGG